jgi:hypothetical protein
MHRCIRPHCYAMQACLHWSNRRRSKFVAVPEMASINDMMSPFAEDLARRRLGGFRAVQQMEACHAFVDRVHPVG